MKDINFRGIHNIVNALNTMNATNTTLLPPAHVVIDIARQMYAQVGPGDGGNANIPDSLSKNNDGSYDSGESGNPIVGIIIGAAIGGIILIAILCCACSKISCKSTNSRKEEQREKEAMADAPDEAAPANFYARNLALTTTYDRSIETYASPHTVNSHVISAIPPTPATPAVTPLQTPYGPLYFSTEEYPQQVSQQYLQQHPTQLSLQHPQQSFRTPSPTFPPVYYAR